MATTMNVSLTEELRSFVDQQVREGGFASNSDYVRALIRERRQRDSGERLRQLIAEGIASGPAEPVGEAWFEQLRAMARQRPGP